MAFPQEQPVTPDRRGGVTIVFYIPDPDDAEEAQYSNIIVQIKYSDATTKEKGFDLLARLGDDAPGLTHLANLVALKTYILARIESELLA